MNVLCTSNGWTLFFENTAEVRELMDGLRRMLDSDPARDRGKNDYWMYALRHGAAPPLEEDLSAHLKMCTVLGRVLSGQGGSFQRYSIDIDP